MKRAAVVLALAAAVALPLRAQDPRQDEKSVQEKVERALAEELKRLREVLVDVAKEEAGKAGGAPVAAPKGNVEKALELITVDLLKKHANFLASDDLEGRNAGYPGNDKASEYISEVMKKAGLKPVGDKDADGNATYFQNFRVAGKKTRNCLGVIEGSDPDLKKEIVVIGAHHDHVGTVKQGHWGQLGGARGEDEIWNGADDNASGTTTVLGLVRAFGEGGLRAKRTILFMTFSGEEAGLLGSRHYVNNPIAPIEQHVYMLNLDMVGRNPDKPVGIHGVGSADGDIIRKAVEDAVARSGLKAVLHDKVQLMGGDSDHSSFRDKGVPFSFFFTGFHADYHQVTDHPDKLAYDNMVKVGRTSAHILLSIGDGKDSPRFKGMKPIDPGDARPRRRLGFTPGDVTSADYEKLHLGKDEGAMKVDQVTPDTVAAKCGLKEGDWIVSVGGAKLRRGSESADLRTAIDKVKAGADVPIEVVRGGEKVTLKAVWEK